MVAEQITVGPDILMPTPKTGVTDMVKVLEVAGLPVAHALEVRIVVIKSVLERVVLV